MRRSLARSCSAIFLALLALLLLPGHARAQTTGQGKLADVLYNLYYDNAVINYTVLVDMQDEFPGFTARLQDLSKQVIAPLFIVKQLGSQISSFPLGSSAGGFAWTFNPEIGTFSRASGSFGPTFAERALTVGKKKFNFGFNYQHASFDNIEGKSLKDGSIWTYMSAEYGQYSYFWQDSMKLNVTSDTVGVFGTLGVTDRFDLGFAVPIVRVKMNASLTSSFGSTSPSFKPSGNTFVESRSGSASGIGDVVVRAKYNVLKSTGGGIAAAADIRLGTGDEMNFLGVPGSQVKVFMIASSAYNRLSPHVNFGYTLSSASKVAKDTNSPLLKPPDELNYVGGVDYVVSPRATVALDLVGRTQFKAGRLVDAAASFSSSYRQFEAHESDNLAQLLFAVGAKANLFSNLLVSGNVLLPMRKTGVTGTSFVIGMDYSF